MKWLKVLFVILAVAFVGVWGYLGWVYWRGNFIYSYYWIKYTLVNGRMPYGLYPLLDDVKSKVEGKYKLSDQFDKNDETGRTLVYYDRVGAEQLTEQYVFDGWKEIEDSDDKYLVYETIWAKGAVPLQFKVRVIMDDESSLPQTELRLDNLTPRVREMEILGKFADLTESQLEDLIKPKDVFGFASKLNGGVVLRDGNDIPVAEWVEIRRFK